MLVNVVVSMPFRNNVWNLDETGKHTKSAYFHHHEITNKHRIKRISGLIDASLKLINRGANKIIGWWLDDLLYVFDKIFSFFDLTYFAKVSVISFKDI